MWKHIAELKARYKLLRIYANMNDFHKTYICSGIYKITIHKCRHKQFCNYNRCL